MARSFRLLTRDLHLYVGLFLSPFVLVYALSTIALNHAWLPWRGEEQASVREVSIDLPAAQDGIEQAKAILGQVGVAGEIGFITRQPNRSRLIIPVERPGEQVTVRVDLARGTATVEERSTGAWNALVLLHRMPGPHLVDIRGNWLFIRMWSWLADATVYLVLFLSATGVYLWALLEAERRAGLALLGAGTLSFLVLTWALLA